jgi:hypothetical protein
MITFKKYIELIKEDNISGGGGSFGDAPSFGHGGDIGNNDFYATGYSGIPYVMGMSRRVKRKSKKRKSKKRKSRKRKGKR